MFGPTLRRRAASRTNHSLPIAVRTAVRFRRSRTDRKIRYRRRRMISSRAPRVPNASSGEPSVEVVQPLPESASTASTRRCRPRPRGKRSLGARVALVARRGAEVSVPIGAAAARDAAGVVGAGAAEAAVDVGRRQAVAAETFEVAAATAGLAGTDDVNVDLRGELPSTRVGRGDRDRVIAARERGRGSEHERRCRARGRGRTVDLQHARLDAEL